MPAPAKKSTKKGRRVRRADSLPGTPGAPIELDPGPGVGAMIAVGSPSDPDDEYWAEVYTKCLKQSLALFAKDILGMEVAPHIESWSDLVNEESRVAVLAARDHGKSAFFSYAYPIWRAWSEPGCEVYLFSKTLEQAQEFLAIIIYGLNNLRGVADIPEIAYLMPTAEDYRNNLRLQLNKSNVIFINGSRIRAVGYGKAIRGRHPKYVVLDDVLNDNDMWSETERRKNITYYQSAIVNMVMPSVQGDKTFAGGQAIIVGTPYHMADLYAWLEKNEVYAYRRYPGIVRTAQGERALFPWRWSLEQLYGKKKEIGSVAFSREILCLPITDDISVFPSYLFPPLYDSSLTLRPTRSEIEARRWECYMGVDIARSASVGADWFVIFTIAKDPEGQRYLVDINRTQGLPFKRQLELIAMEAERYNPSLVYIESNAMQQIYTDEMRRMTDVPVREFVTLATNKYPLDRGVPGLRIILENQKLTIPRGDEYSRTQTNIWQAEASQFGFIDGKLQGIGAHDDTVMAWWFAEEAAKAGGFSFAFGDEDGADAFDTPEGEGDDDYEDVLLGDASERGDELTSLF